jgi:gluconolactonase
VVVLADPVTTAGAMMLQKRRDVTAVSRAAQGGRAVPAIEVSDLEALGHGIERPEQVLVSRDGSVFASDKASAVAQVDPDGSLHRMGHAGGEPNGIALNADGHFLIANFGLGVLQVLDPVSGTVRAVVRDTVAGRPLRWINYVLVDSSGALWVSVCTESSDLVHTIAQGTPDGYLFLGAGASHPEVVADGVTFPNCMALDDKEEYLYVVRTLTADVVRFPIEGVRLGPEELFSPALGDRRPDEYGDHAAALLGQRAVTSRWGMADGCAFDAAGNLWVTLARANRIVAVSPQRAVTTIVEDPDGRLISGPTSIAWGGADMRDVYFGSLETPYIVRGRSSIPGLPMVHQRAPRR